jgi:hypothetical protein
MPKKISMAIKLVFHVISLYTISGRGWAKYRDLSVADQLFDLRATDKSRYFGITEFNKTVQ